MRRVSESEAQDRLHELLRAAAGERIAITADDGRVAELGPAAADRRRADDTSEDLRPSDEKTPDERQRAKERLMRHLRSRVPTGEPRNWTRDELTTMIRRVSAIDTTINLDTEGLGDDKKCGRLGSRYVGFNLSGLSNRPDVRRLSTVFFPKSRGHAAGAVKVVYPVGKHGVLMLYHHGIKLREVSMFNGPILPIV
jgi:antitoxin (DNA-binding transcriptional repressor) of toxin-antitoxin stability system